MEPGEKILFEFSFQNDNTCRAHQHIFYEIGKYATLVEIWPPQVGRREKSWKTQNGHISSKYKPFRTRFFSKMTHSSRSTTFIKGVMGENLRVTRFSKKIDFWHTPKSQKIGSRNSTFRVPKGLNIASYTTMSGRIFAKKILFPRPGYAEKHRF